MNLLIFFRLYSIMKVKNTHKRRIYQSKEKISVLLETLASANDAIWPNKKWPSIYFNNGLKIGSKGGHGSIKYTIVEYTEGEFIRFKFTKPKGFKGFHEFIIKEIQTEQVEICHTIKMNVSGSALFIWIFAIRFLHDALMEDAFDKVESQFSGIKKQTKYSIWVKIMRSFFKFKHKIGY